MNNNQQKHIRVLGITPSARGLGFALMEGENTLINWGIKTAKGGDKNDRSLSNAANLIDHYRPEVVAVEDPKESRRSPRIQALTEEIVALAEEGNIEIKRYSRKQLNLALLHNERGTKHALAECIAARFPDELGFRLPPRRRLWTSEPYQMDIFDAVALAEHFLRDGSICEEAG